MFPLIGFAIIGLAAILEGCSRRPESEDQFKGGNFGLKGSRSEMPARPQWCDKAKKLEKYPSLSSFVITNSQAEKDCRITPATSNYESKYLECSLQLLQQGKFLYAQTILRSLKVNSPDASMSKKALKQLLKNEESTLLCPNQGLDLDLYDLDRDFNHTRRITAP